MSDRYAANCRLRASRSSISASDRPSDLKRLYRACPGTNISSDALSLFAAARCCSSGVLVRLNAASPAASSIGAPKPTAAPVTAPPFPPISAPMPAPSPVDSNPEVSAPAVDETYLVESLDGVTSCLFRRRASLDAPTPGTNAYPGFLSIFSSSVGCVLATRPCAAPRALIGKPTGGYTSGAAAAMESDSALARLCYMSLYIMSVGVPLSRFFEDFSVIGCFVQLRCLFVDQRIKGIR